MEATDVVAIGAGPSGLAVAACLQKRQINFIILEKEHQVGSSWRKHYERLHLHTTKSRSSLPFRSFNHNYPRYVSRSDVVRHLDEYAASFTLKPCFGGEVRTARKDGIKWLIGSTSQVLAASYLVVATGLNAEPVTPHFPGAENFRGRLLHVHSTSIQDRSPASASFCDGIPPEFSELPTPRQKR